MTGDGATRGLVDTNVVILLPGLDPGELPDELVISAVTLAELSVGPHVADNPVERAKRIGVLQHVEATFDPLPFDTEAARAFGLVTAAVLAAGRQPRRRVADLMIASVAMVNRLPLYTTNSADFVGLDGLVEVRAVSRPDSGGTR